MTPSLFYGTAISTCLGLAMGLALHGPWQSRDGGPQILFPSAAAAELARPLNDADIVDAAAVPAEEPAYADVVLADTDPLPADSLPVTRLIRLGGAARPAAVAADRVSIDAAAPDDGVAVAAADGPGAATSENAPPT